MKKIVHELENVNGLRRVKVMFLHEEPRDFFLEIHKSFSYNEKKLARLQHKASLNTPQSIDDRYNLASYFVKEVTESAPVWGDLKIKII